MTVVGIEANIVNGLLAAVEAQTYTGKKKDNTSTGNLAYAWPEVTLDVSNKPYYLAVDVVLNNHGFQPVAGNNVERMGFLIIKVVWPKNEGIIRPSEVASAIALAWKAGTTIFGTGVKVVVSPDPYLSSPLPDPTRVSIAVNIPWKAYKTN